ncbi:MAG: hypothetical protein HGJ94_19530 [Desulfosarcina sp.]|nr:hypothetical protein [Desulfosarcina sp.]MBC2741678.1 hypothetical protein [Desulfosarcina sp.]MBC2764592.1 hypothetical protein [Desulfosarcina sp.]
MRFATDTTLGKLGRHLRAAGFDTLCQHQCRRGDFFDTVEADRVILTRTTAVKVRFKSRPLVFIRNNDPFQQMMQVVRELGIGQSDLRPFSRCLECNMVISQVGRDAVRGRVPDYVWQRHQTFHACGKCRRIYWAGSHHDRMCNRLAAIPRQKEKTHER